MSTPGWEGILEEGEEILWQGRPDGRIALRPSNWFMLLFGIAFGGFALFWMVMAGALGGGTFALFGLPHFLIGAGMVWSAVYWSAYRRRRSWYTLTNRNAYIATDLPIMGKRLKSWPITRDMKLEFVDEEPATIWFASRLKRGKNGTYRVPVGFERIEDGRKVYALFREARKQAA